jgi:hypothetical protein
MPDVSPIQLIILIIIGVPYFVPSIVAFARHHHNAWAIFALNLITGWTAIGWVGAFVWALTNPSRTVPAAAPPPAASGTARFDPQTGRPIKGYDPQTGEPIYHDQ